MDADVDCICHSGDFNCPAVSGISNFNHFYLLYFLVSLPLCVSFQERRHTLKGVRENDLFGEQPDHRASGGSEEAVPLKLHTAEGVATGSEKKVHFFISFVFFSFLSSFPLFIISRGNPAFYRAFVRTTLP